MAPDRPANRGRFVSKRGLERGEWSIAEIGETLASFNCPICGEPILIRMNDLDRKGRSRKVVECQTVRCGFADRVRLGGWRRPMSETPPGDPG